MGMLDRILGREDGSRLVTLMRALSKEDTPRTRDDFYRELLRSSLSIAAPGAVDWQGLQPGESVASRDTQIRFIASRGPDGMDGMLAFTGDDAVRAWRPAGCDTVSLRVPELCGLALRCGLRRVLINIRGPVAGGMLRDHELSALAAGRAPGPEPRCETEALAPGGTIGLEPPMPAPTEALSAALRSEAALHRSILSLHIARARLSVAQERPLLLIELEAGADHDSVIPAFLEGAAKRLQGSDPIPDAMPLQPASPLLALARERASRIYSREAA